MPIDRALAVHFAQRMKVTTLNAETVSLIGPHGAVPIKVVPVEHGLLVFVSPAQQLLPATRYTLFIKGATDLAGQALPFTALGFDTMQLGGEAAPTLITGKAAVAPGSNAQSPATVDTPSNGGRASQTSQHSPSDAYALQAIAAANNPLEPEAWTPGRANFSGNWRSKRAHSPLQDLPPLRAPDGTTALAGQVLTLHSRALPNVTLSIGTQSARTDATGRFLLIGPVGGERVLVINANSANR